VRPLGLRIFLALVLGVALIASLLVNLRRQRQIAEYQRRHETDVQALRSLQDALHKKALEKAPPIEVEEIPSGGTHARPADREAVIARLDRQLADDHAEMDDLQKQLSAARDQNAGALADAQANLLKQQADAQAQLADLQRKLDAAVADSEIARQRAAALQADNAKLQPSPASAATGAPDVAHILSSLQDINRRREVYLTSILRRYRDITGEFNAMSGMLDTSHPPSPGACSGADLTRIQNAVSSAEDDLRQISELNARSQKLEKQLPTK
jgi:multidrug efflux pump subunit AcrA (membrane-fusion protein)